MGFLDGMMHSMGLGSGGNSERFPSALKPSVFELRTTISYGFPSHATCLAVDHVQELLAVGFENGDIKVFGSAGVERMLEHPDTSISVSPVLQLKFCINHGELISVTGAKGDTLNRCSLKRCTIEDSLKFKERISCITVAPLSRWLFVGTEKGNLYVVDNESFSLSGYVVMWNQVSDLKTRSGAVVAIEEHPHDSSKLLIGYSLGNISLWDVLLQKQLRSYGSKLKLNLTSFCWHTDGSKFLASYQSGELFVWSMKLNSEPIEKMWPSGNASNIIMKALWAVSDVNNESFIIHTGSPSVNDECGFGHHYVSVRCNETEKTCIIDRPVVDLSLFHSTCTGKTMNPIVIIALMSNGLRMLCLDVSGFSDLSLVPSLQISASPITFLAFFAHFPQDFLNDMMAVHDEKKTMDWPLNGGRISAVCDLQSADIIVTGHLDGAIRFWDISGIAVHSLLTVQLDFILRQWNIRVPHNRAVNHITMCVASRIMLVSLAAGNVLLFQWAAAASRSNTAVCLKMYVPPIEKPAGGDCMNQPMTTQKSKTPRKKRDHLFSRTSSKHIESSSEEDETAQIEKLTKLNFSTDWAKKALDALRVPSTGTCDMNVAAAWLFDHGKTLCEEEMKALREDLNNNDDSLNDSSGNGEALEINLKTAGQAISSLDESDGVENIESDATNSKMECELSHNEDSGMGFQPLLHVQSFLSSKLVSAVGRSSCLALAPHLGLLSIADKSGVYIVDFVHQKQLYAISPDAISTISQQEKIPDMRSSVVSTMTFSSSYLHDGDTHRTPSLWIGTHCGCIFTIILALCDPPDTTEGSVEDLPQVYVPRLGPSFVPGNTKIVHNKVLLITLLDHRGWFVDRSLDDENRDHDVTMRLLKEKRSVEIEVGKETATMMKSSEIKKRSTSKSLPERPQFVVVSTSDEAYVLLLPSLTVVSKIRIPDVQFTSSRVIGVFGEAALLLFSDSGAALLLSALSLVPLLPAPPESSSRTNSSLHTAPLMVACGAPLRATSIAKDGRIVAVSVTSFIQRFSILADENYLSMPDSVPTLVTARDMPSRPVNTSFFKSLFNNSSSDVSNRDKLFEQANTTSTRRIADHVNYAGVDDCKNNKSASVAATMNETQLRLNERGEKLAKAAEQSERLREQSNTYLSKIRDYNKSMSNKKW